MIHYVDFLNSLPLLIVAAASLITVIIEIIMKKSENTLLGFSILALVSAIITSFGYLDKEIFAYNGLLKINSIAITFSVIVLSAVIITLFASKFYLEKNDINYGEYYSLIMFSVTGMLLMIFANDLIIIFIGLELMSICFYVLAGFLRKRIKSNESALKYFLLGAFMTGFLLYGMALMYGVIGTTNLTTILSSNPLFKTPVFLIGLSLFLIGFFFKIGIFPFNMWVPDVYDGAPTIVSGFMSTAGKIAAVGTVIPLIIYFNIIDFKILLSILAVLTMLFGNVIALAQTNIKRLLAYSSIASAGYILVGAASMNDFALKGITFYLISYTFMQLGAFIVVSLIEKPTADFRDFMNISLDDYKGLAKKNPALASMFTLFLFSLAGIPPFAGFWGKYYLFYAAIKSNLIWLSVIAIALSVISVYYYLRIIVNMWFQDSQKPAEEKIRLSPAVSVALIISVAGTLVFGVYPQWFFSIFRLII